MGLRERKKTRTREGILDAMRSLLEDRDYNAVTMEDIAAEADIAVGTLYNYFRAKPDLLFSLIGDSDERYLQEAEEMIANKALSGDARLTDLMVLATEFCVGQLGKSAWRHLSAAALVNTNEDVGLTYATTTRKHQALVTNLMVQLQAEGEIRPDIDAETAADIVFSMKSKLFLDFISDPEETLADHRSRVLAGVRFFLQGTAAKA